MNLDELMRFWRYHNHHKYIFYLADDSFMKATQVLVTWLERGDCARRSANTFYSMIQSVNSHVRRLMNEKGAHDQELEQMKLAFRQRHEGILRQCKSISFSSGQHISLLLQTFSSREDPIGTHMHTFHLAI